VEMGPSHRVHAVRTSAIHIRYFPFGVLLAHHLGSRVDFLRRTHGPTSGNQA
jgi:hypothetical protein